MSELQWGLVSGFMVGCLVGSLGAAISTADVTNRYRVAIEQCEKDLPRSQRCKINAIPVGEQ